MTRIQAFAPASTTHCPERTAHLPAGGRAPLPHVAIAEDGGIEAIVLELEQQSQRSRQLRNDARDAARERQAASIRQTRRAARFALAGSLVQQAASAAASLGQSLSGAGRAERARGTAAEQPAAASSGTDTAPVAPSAGRASAGGAPGDASGDQAAPATDRRAAGVHGAATLGQTAGTLLEHLGGRASTRAEVAEHAEKTYRDVAEDAGQAEQDARRMSDKALQHLDAILTARREAQAAIVRG